MKYLSTRGGEERLTFEEAVMRGLAPNGGLYIPSEIPSLPSDWQQSWKDLTFPELSLEILSLFIPSTEIPRADLKNIIDTSYATFRHPQTTPLHKISEKEYILELFHGPTFAFKDVALQFVGNIFEYFLKRRNQGKAADAADREKLTILGATSGDTGSAAIYGVRGKDDISIFMLFPKGRVSPIQEAQMTSILDSNVHCVSVEGTFDDCQDAVKACFSDPTFNGTHKLGAVNSINWARILAQIVYYFHSYLALSKAAPGKDVQYVVPSGNFGDILAGYYAKRLGLPSSKLVVATNENDILTRFFQSGKYEKAGDGTVRETLSPAMDILVSSNFERLLWYFALETVGGGKDQAKASETLKGWMDALKKNGGVDCGAEVLKVAQRDFLAGRVSNEETAQTIKLYFEKESYVADPHTAVGLKVTSDLLPSTSDNAVIITLSTAHPAKFIGAVQDALPGLNFAKDVIPKELEGIEQRPRRVFEVKDEAGVRQRMVDVAASLIKENVLSE